MKLLRAFTAIAGFVVLIGTLAFLYHHGDMIPHYKTFSGEPASFRSCTIIIEQFNQHGSLGVIQLGLLLLILNPILRVILSLLSFIHERNWKYVIISGTVASTLLYSLLSSAG